MRFVAVLPSIWQPYTDACVDSMAPELLGNCLVLDNTCRNRGVAASWNDGARFMYSSEADWLVIVSAAMRFGAPGGADFLQALERASGDEWAIEAGPCPRQPGLGFGWHLIAFPRWVFDRVGMFDENFWPGYFEDLDYGHRIRLASGWQLGIDPMWPKVDTDGEIASLAHGVELAGITDHPEPLIRYYALKWGVPPGKGGEWDHPFGRADLGLDFWPSPTGSREERIQ